jgi:uncharacterized protein (TIGR02246 family)
MRVPPFLLACFIVASPATAQDRTPASADEAAVRAVVAAYVEARRQQDRDAVAALLTEDADQHTSGGAWRRGRTAFAAGAVSSSAQNPGDRSITVEAVRFLTAGVALVDGPYEIGAPGDVARRLWATILVIREPGGWRIAAIRNKLPA